jgi:holin-like protein
MHAFFRLAAAFLVLAACDIAGRVLVWALAIPVPGTVVGILLLLGGILVLRRVPEPLRETAEFLLAHLNFFYIPAGVGVMGYGALLADDLWPIVVALFASTFLAMIAAGFAFQFVVRLAGRDRSR